MYEVNTNKKKSMANDVEGLTLEHSNSSDLLPEERLHSAYKEHRQSLKEKELRLN
ncbi:hypothetical protein VCHA47P369_70354 [Vibrio chagasii]|nr:hypothetical protein VCHA48P435_60050 [Vibrio chagasii]CAH7352741.1 hypothetical protein VCHA47P369_70354 [Vibrio chagasii]CAH7384967.1 hypothetical protein VCHA51O448_60303 [Vibrio chagasii]